MNPDDTNLIINQFVAFKFRRQSTEKVTHLRIEMDA